MSMVACCIPCSRLGVGSPSGCRGGACGCYILEVYCALHACPFFICLGCICCACKGKHESGRGMTIFSARGRNVGEVSLKVGRTHALSILSPSLEISRKKSAMSYAVFLVLRDIRSERYDLVLSREGADAVWDPRDCIRQSKSRWRNMKCRVSCDFLQTCYIHGCFI